jgi:hypothetical protein
MSRRLWNWLKWKGSPGTPTVQQTTIGELQVPSGVLLLADPMHHFDPVRIEAVSRGRFPGHAQFIHYPEGGQRIAKVGLAFRGGTPESRQVLGSVGVDTATVFAVDAGVYEQFWQEVGPERIGRTRTPTDHRAVARLIEQEFGLKSRQVDFLASEFEEPISEELEERILAYLQTFPEYAEFTWVYFHVQTMNTFERILEAMRDRFWTEVVLDVVGGASLLAFSSGFGDGTYPVEGLYRSGELVGVEVEFIGPAQDKVLEAFPMLRF